MVGYQSRIIVLVGKEDGNGLVLVWDRCFGGSGRWQWFGISLGSLFWWVRKMAMVWYQSGIVVLVGQEDGNGLVLVWDRCFGGSGRWQWLDIGLGSLFGWVRKMAMVGYQPGIVVLVGKEDGNGWILVWDRCLGGSGRWQWLDISLGSLFCGSGRWQWLDISLGSLFLWVRKMAMVEYQSGIVAFILNFPAKI